MIKAPKMSSNGIGCDVRIRRERLHEVLQARSELGRVFECVQQSDGNERCFLARTWSTASAVKTESSGVLDTTGNAASTVRRCGGSGQNGRGNGDGRFHRRCRGRAGHRHVGRECRRVVAGLVAVALITSPAASAGLIVKVKLATPLPLVVTVLVAR